MELAIHVAETVFTILGSVYMCHLCNLQLVDLGIILKSVSTLNYMGYVDCIV